MLSSLKKLSSLKLRMKIGDYNFKLWNFSKQKVIIVLKTTYASYSNTLHRYPTIWKWYVLIAEFEPFKSLVHNSFVYHPKFTY